VVTARNYERVPFPRPVPWIRPPEAAGGAFFPLATLRKNLFFSFSSFSSEEGRFSAASIGKESLLPGRFLRRDPFANGANFFSAVKESAFFQKEGKAAQLPPAIAKGSKSFSPPRAAPMGQSSFFSSRIRVHRKSFRVVFFFSRYNERSPSERPPQPSLPCR